jgi:hypothetical protein
MVFLQAVARLPGRRHFCATQFEGSAMMDYRVAGMFILGVLSMSLGCSDKPRPRNNNCVADEPNEPKEEPKEDPKIDEGPRLAFDYDPMMHFGLTVIKDAYGDPVSKRLTFAPDGATNSTLIHIDNKFFEFGGPEGLWAPKVAKFPNGSRSTWATSNSSLMIHQVLKIVLSEQPVTVAKGVRQRILDTCLIRYEIQNIDTRDHWVGLRMVVDTLIGSNDGVPFAVARFATNTKSMSANTSPSSLTLSGTKSSTGFATTAAASRTLIRSRRPCSRGCSFVACAVTP